VGEMRANGGAWGEENDQLTDWLVGWDPLLLERDANWNAISQSAAHYHYQHFICSQD